MGIHSGNGGHFSRAFQPKCHADVWPAGNQTASVSAGMVVSGGVEYPLCLDGGGCGSGYIQRRIGRPQPRLKFDGSAVGGEFLLATVVFQRQGIWLCLLVAPAVIGSNYSPQ